MWPPALLAALLLLLAAPLCDGTAEVTDGSDSAEPTSGEDGDLDDDSDSAPFMIVVEHRRGGSVWWRCSGSLVSQRTGVTSAECARGPREPEAGARELWALAAAAAAGQAGRGAGARRVSRVASAAAPPALPAALDDPQPDLAVLELERPFAGAARVRPILMATAPNECSGGGGMCHVVRSVARGAGRALRLRIVDATLAGDAPCARHVPHWAALRDRALCLTGPELCESEWGAGVVCGGKLCGVLSQSAGGGGGAGAGGGGAGGGAGGGERGCGDTHAAQSVARWRRFLHCAHTLRACGRGNCADLCTEKQLIDQPDSGGGGGLEGGEMSRPALEAAPPTRVHLSAEPPTVRAAPTRWSSRAEDATALDTLSPPAPLNSDTPTPPLPPPPEPSPSRPSPLFEPNRPDFRAGEYGDNAAEYGAGGDEGVVPTSSTSPSAPSPPSSTGASPPGGGPKAPPAARAPPAVAERRSGSPPPELAARHELSSDGELSSRSDTVDSTRSTVLMLLLFFILLLNL